MNIGILGNGQLGQMLQQSVADISDLNVALYDLNAHTPKALTAFINRVERISFETENIPSDIVEQLKNEAADRLYPNLQALKTFQNRLTEKATLRQAGIETADFCAINHLDDIHTAIDTLGLPLILKTTTEGYDGKGQFVLKDANDAASAWQCIGGRELIAEAFVSFKRELSVIATRNNSGDIAIWPMTDNRHHEGILRLSLYPAEQLSEQKQALAERYITQLAEQMNYVGTLTLELFETEHGLIANEVAPRVHNSGHWSIEGAETSQFRNHMLAISGRVIGSTHARAPFAAMINVIGDESPAEVLPAAQRMGFRDPNAKETGVYRHSYNKQARPNRKLGHVNVLANSEHELTAQIKRLSDLLP